MTIKEWIKSNGWTQGEFAKKIDVGRATVEKWCQGRAVPDRRNMKTLIELGYEKPDSPTV